MTELSVDQLGEATVYDRDGAKLGKVRYIFLDSETDKPSFVSVKAGSGGGERLIPVAAARLDGDELQVAYDEDTVDGAPTVDTDEGLDSADQDELVEYYSQSDAADRAADDEDGEDGGTDQDETASNAEIEDEGLIIRRAERLTVGTEAKEVGKARVRKRVVTKTETVEVPLRREELVIEREPLTDEEAEHSGDLGEEEEVIVLREERAVVEKKVVGVEKVRVSRRIVAETETISAELKEEEIEIEGEGSAENAAEDSKEAPTE